MYSLIQRVRNFIFIQCGSRVRRVVYMCVPQWHYTKVPGVFYVPFWGRAGSHIRLHNGSKLFTMGFYYYLFIYFFLKQPLILVRKNSCVVVKNNGMYSFIESLGYDSIKEGKWWSHRHGNIRPRVTINILKVCHTLKFSVLHLKWASSTFNRVFTFWGDLLASFQRQCSDFSPEITKRYLMFHYALYLVFFLYYETIIIIISKRNCIVWYFNIFFIFHLRYNTYISIGKY